MSPIEEAQAYKNFMIKTNMTQEEIARRFGKSRSHITNLLGLLSLPSDVQEDLITGKISMSHARVLSKLESEDAIKELSAKIKNEGISVRTLEDISKDTDTLKRKHTIKIKEVPTRHRIYENTMREAIGTKVTISSNKITIPFDSGSDLDRIMEILNIEIGE